MKRSRRILCVCTLGVCWLFARASAQDLAPRAYVITPVGSTALTAGYTYNTGDVSVDPSVPLTDFHASFQTQTVSYFHSFNTLGRSSNITVLAPYAFGNFSALLKGSEAAVSRSGVADSRVRFAINLFGGPAMGAKDFGRWKEKGLLGASLTVLVPSGQYDPAKLINIGSNRWGFKPEVGLSRGWGQRWVLESYFGGWFYTPNNFYYPGGNRRTQAAIFAMEAHLNYYVKPRLWISLDGNFWNGGRTTVNGVLGYDLQRNSRAGATLALPVNRQQMLKFSYSRGTYVTIGGDYQTISAAWQYAWFAGKE